MVLKAPILDAVTLIHIEFLLPHRLGQENKDANLNLKKMQRLAYVDFCRLQ